MKSRISAVFLLGISVILMISMVLSGCQPAAATPVVEKPTAVSEQSAAPAEEVKAPVVNSLGVELPADAAPIEEQVLRYPANEFKWLSWDATVYDLTPGGIFGIHDPCTRTDKNFELHPAGCESWEISEDGLTWTFHLPKDKVWSDGEPVTADDWVFTMQRYARPDYDFEWFYSMGNIVNWSAVVNGEVDASELGVKKVDDYTFSVTTTDPIPYIAKLFTVVWVTPQHIVKDRLADGSWAMDPATAVSAGPFKLDHYDKGKEIVWVANDKYTGPYPPMLERIELYFMDSQTRFAAFKNSEVDIIGLSSREDLPPATIAEILATPEMKDQMLSWPNFITYYLFFDTWNEPFDNLLVRQAFSHAIDRQLLIDGPLANQASIAFSMNPPGFPGSDVENIKDIQGYDPKLAAQLMEEAGYPGGEGFPELTLYTRSAYPALTNAAEAIAAMLKDNLGVIVQIQDLDYSIYSEMLSTQKSTKSGDLKFSIVPYEFDFVDGSNLLGVWGGCESDTDDLSKMPGRHTWYNEEFNAKMCEANTLMDAEDQRNELYKQAEKILLEDVGLIPLYHGTNNVLLQPNVKGPALDPDKEGRKTFWRYEYTGNLTELYIAEVE